MRSCKRRATILLVEDDPGVARLERLRLERAGYAVATAATAEEGLDRVAEGGIDLIVLDQKLSRRHQRPGVLPPGQGGRAQRAGDPGDRHAGGGPAGRGPAGRRARLRPQDAQTSSTTSSRSSPACSTRSAPSASWPSRGVVARGQRGAPARSSSARSPTASGWSEALKEADRAQGPVPGHARPRAAQPPGPDQQRRADHEGPGPERPQLPVVGQGHRGPGQAHDPDGRRPARRLPDHPRQGRPPEGAGRPGGRGRPGRRGQPAPDRRTASIA